MSRTIHHQIPAPATSRFVLTPLWRTPLPKLPLLPTLICGVCAIVGWVAPSWLETMLPGYHTKYLPIILLIVCFALIRSVYRLIRSIVGILFFGAATLAIVLTIFPALSSYSPSSTLMARRSLSLPNYIADWRSIPGRSSLAKALPDSNREYRSLPSPLPDEAYFPKARSGSDTAEQFSVAHASRGIHFLKGYLLKR